MQDPLKQGLKHLDSAISEGDLIIRMQDPLKQGLKLVIKGGESEVFRDSNARSTKTRIETSG